MRMYLTLPSNICCLNDKIWARDKACAAHIHLCSSSSLTLTLLWLSGHYFEGAWSVHLKMQQGTVWWNLQRIVHIASPDGLYIRHTKWQSRREEALDYPFQMGTVTPNGQCDASAKPNRSIAQSSDFHGENAPEIQQGAVLHHNKSGPSR